jgi:peroxiredoxin
LRLLGARLVLLWLVAVALGCAGARPSVAPLYAESLAVADGTRYSLEALRGKVAVVTFVATWCFPCLVALPALSDLENRYGARGLQVVAIGMDLEGPRVLEPFAEKYQLSFPLLVPSQAMREGRSPFGPIRELPSTFVLDRNGGVAVAFAGAANPEELRRLVEGLLP